MKKKWILPLLLLFSFLGGCSSPAIITKWKDKSLVDRNYHKILVVGILKDSLVDLRRTVENTMVLELKNLGYNAVSALEEFGQGGLLKLEQEATYVTLCNRGIDAVISVALLDKNKQHHHLPADVNDYSAQYYYNRIWNYRSMQTDQVVAVGVANYNTEFLWETLLFDLSTLTPRYSAQTKTFNTTTLFSNSETYGKMFIARMTKTKVLSKQQPALKEQELKAF